MTIEAPPVSALPATAVQAECSVQRGSASDCAQRPSRTERRHRAGSSRHFVTTAGTTFRTRRHGELLCGRLRRLRAARALREPRAVFPGRPIESHCSRRGVRPRRRLPCSPAVPAPARARPTQDDSAFTYLLDRKPATGSKTRSTPCRRCRKTSNLLRVQRLAEYAAAFLRSTRTSLTVGTDGVVRYTVVVTSPAGARNVNYEGIRCDTYEWRLYASINDDHDGWDQHGRERLHAHRERRAERVSRGAVSGLFLREQAARRATRKQIVNNIQYKRTQSFVNLADVSGASRQ